ncbi:hypothetical protein M758_9G017700 [Ceratodon purpureus]|nr:hypothetical protein M758_9G017700 [Ceratodon purpureus]
MKRQRLPYNPINRCISSILCTYIAPESNQTQALIVKLGSIGLYNMETCLPLRWLHLQPVIRGHIKKLLNLARLEFSRLELPLQLKPHRLILSLQLRNPLQLRLLPPLNVRQRRHQRIEPLHRLHERRRHLLGLLQRLRRHHRRLRIVRRQLRRRRIALDRPRSIERYVRNRTRVLLQLRYDVHPHQHQHHSLH